MHDLRNLHKMHAVFGCRFSGGGYRLTMICKNVQTSCIRQGGTQDTVHYRVRVQIIVKLTKAAEPLDREDSSGNNEVRVRHLKGVGDALLPCQLLLIPAVLTAHVRPHTKVV